MKNMADIETRLRAELNQWFIKQIRNEYDDFYLYYLPTTAEHNGGFVITSEAPSNPEYQIIQGRINKGATIDQNMNHFREIVKRLPILEI